MDYSNKNIVSGFKYKNGKHFRRIHYQKLAYSQIDLFTFKDSIFYISLRYMNYFMDFRLILYWQKPNIMQY